MLNDDVIAIIKEYAGITPLDVVNKYYELQGEPIFSADFARSKPRVKVIMALVNLIPHFYKRMKRGHVDSLEKHFFESIMRGSFRDEYVSHTDVNVAFALLSTPIGYKFPFRKKPMSQWKRKILA